MNLEKTNKINYEQGSAEWLEWRKTGIGASNMSVIMGSLPFAYEDILELWKEKVGMEVKPFNISAAVQEGWDNEPEARRILCERLGFEMQPECFTHPQYSFIRASLDAYGYDKDGNPVIAEIKCPQITSYRKAARGKILDYYYTQVQQQIACADVDFSYYYVYRKGEKDLLFKVPRNETYIKELLRRGQIFWDCVVNKKPCLPPMLGLDMRKESDPFICDGMDWEVVKI